MEFKNSRVLIIDDHSLLRQMVSVALKGAGLTLIDQAVDGAAGFDKIKEANDAGVPYQIVFLDWTMPNMNGLEVLSACRADRRFDNMAIIMLTSESEESSIIKAMDNGATAYITKPFKPELLVKKLEDIAKWQIGNAKGAL